MQSCRLHGNIFPDSRTLWKCVKSQPRPNGGSQERGWDERSFSVSYNALWNWQEWQCWKYWWFFSNKREGPGSRQGWFQWQVARKIYPTVVNLSQLAYFLQKSWRLENKEYMLVPKLREKEQTDGLATWLEVKPDNWCWTQPHNYFWVASCHVHLPHHRFLGRNNDRAEKNYNIFSLFSHILYSLTC